MVKNIFVNLLTYNSGGAKVFKKNYIESINNIENVGCKKTFYILTNETRKNNNEYVKFLKIPHIFENIFFLPFTYFVVIPFLIRKYEINKIVNFCDIPVFTKIYQIFYFDWPYAVYPESVVWKKMGAYDKIYRSSKLFLFKNLINNCNLIIAQSQVISDRLKKLYDFQNVKVIKMGFEKKFTKNKINISKLEIAEKILLYPTKYYPHKNVEILIDVAKEIAKKKLPYKIYCTVDKAHHKNVSTIIKQIKKYNLNQILIITGELSRSDFNELFEKSIAILMPTLLETYGIPYIEAIASNKIIFTSNLDFARVTCGDSAFYFDPFDASSIVSVIETAFNNTSSIVEKSNIGSKLLKEQNSWSEIMTKINALIDNK